MGTKTEIAWTESTWNPVRGCSRVSPGCENCYAESVAARFSGIDPKGRRLPYYGLAEMTDKGPRWTREVRMVPEHLGDPVRWKRPRRVFVNSMSDLFHEGLSDDQIAAVFAAMALAPHHQFQVLTKRAKRMREWVKKVTDADNPFTWLWELAEDCDGSASVPGFFEGSPPWDMEWPLPNVWLGVSTEDERRADERIPHLLDTTAAVRFVSYEPALGPVNFWPYLSVPQEVGDGTRRLDWVVVGGESGPSARPFDVDWARSAVSQCISAGVACFVKQMGASVYDTDPARVVTLRSPKGSDPAEWDEALRVREYPRETRAA